MQRNDLSRSHIPFNQDSTLVSVVELSSKSWLLAGLVPGVKRQPRKNLSTDPEALLAQLHRWRDEAVKAGHAIERMVVAFEAGRDGFWLARWLQGRGIEVYVIHASSVPVPREHRRAKTDRLDTEMLLRALLGWLRGEPRHCHMAAIPTLEEEDAKRASRERESLVAEQTRLTNRLTSILVQLGLPKVKITLRKTAKQLPDLRTPEGNPIPPLTLAELRRGLERLAVIKAQIKAIEQARLQRLKAEPKAGTHPMLLMLAKVLGLGIETADMLVHEVLSRNLRDHRAVARYAGNARVRRGMLQLAWRWLLHQKDSDLTKWFRSRTADGRRDTRKTMIVALARKLLIALWRYVTTGVVPGGVKLKPA
jgi:transposase